MASASGPPCDAQLLCSICLDVFTEPVSTPCGHNYCRTCITGFWASSCQIHCPLCMKKFRRIPQLQINTGFRDMVEHFKGVTARGEGDVPVDPGDVPCDICLAPKLKAQKTCLVCLASYCRLHLEPHHRVKTLKKHQLTDPVSDLKDRVCEKHDKLLELFCCEDQTCVCFMCLSDDHAGHGAVPLERAFRERKVLLDRETSVMKMKEDHMSRGIKGGKHSAAQSKTESEKEMADIVKVFNSLAVSRARSQAVLMEVIQEKRKVAQKQVEDYVTLLEQDVAKLRKRRSEMEQLSQTGDHFRLIQRWPSLHVPAHAGEPLDPPSPSSPPFASNSHDLGQQSCVAAVKKVLARVEKTLCNEMAMLIREVRSSGPAGLVPERWWTPPRDKLMILQQYCAVDVTFDAYTANHGFEVSADGKQLKFRRGPPSLTAFFGRRFLNKFILGKEGFSSGRFYYEVQVSDRTNWLLGVARESVSREIVFFPRPEFGVWMEHGMFNLAQSCSEFMNNLIHAPKKIGMFVDYEEGEVTFYDVDARTEINSFSGCAFTEPKPAFISWFNYLASASLSYKPKLYPFFGVFRDELDITLEITPVVPPT